MRIIKLKRQRGRPAISVRLGIAPTPQQTAEYLLELKAAKAKFARAKKTITIAGKKRIAA